MTTEVARQWWQLVWQDSDDNWRGKTVLTADVASNSDNNWGGKQQWWQPRWQATVLTTEVASNSVDNWSGKQQL